MSLPHHNAQNGSAKKSLKPVSPLFALVATQRFKIPQANEVDRIGQLVDLAGKGDSTSRRLALRMHFGTRQSSYYREAAEILGFLSTHRKYVLTDLGIDFLMAGHQARIRMMTCAVLQSPIIRTILAGLLANVVKFTTRKDLEEFIRVTSRLKEPTIRRRAQTIMAWLRWVNKYSGIISVQKDVVRLERQQKFAGEFAIRGSRISQSRLS